MRQNIIRKTAPKVKSGTVKKKNRHTLTPNYWNTRQNEIQIDKEDPGKGYKHFLSKKDIIKFLNILPNRDEIDIEFDAVLLANGNKYTDGWYDNGVIGICAWEKEMTKHMSKGYFNDHRELLEKLDVKFEIKKDIVICFFTENQIKAYLLLHIFLHELGHHHDRINTKSRKDLPRGERYAENYAFKYEKIIWQRFFEAFPE